MANSVYILLGSNIEKERNLPEAVRHLASLVRLVDVSSVYETAPVGLEDQPHFLNAAVEVETELPAAEFRRQVLAEVERRLGRVRTSDKNAPRTIDADMILFNDDVFELDETHHIPDPELLEFPHIAVPIAELAPGMPHPETGERLDSIAARLSARPNGDGQPALCRRTDIKLEPLQDNH
jgi:2-amino-4-hydroxy-6-hydroxymethyldihydropteridine diphosphokinase